MRVRRSIASVVALVLLAAAPVAAAGQRSADGHWFAAWARPQGIAVGGAADPADGGKGPGPLVDQTVRTVLRVTAAGSAVRVHLANRYGMTFVPEGTLLPLTITSVTVARRTSGAALDGRTLRTVTFARGKAVTIQPGGEVVSDPVVLAVGAGEDLAVSVHAQLTPVAPEHGAAFVTSYLTAPASGDHTSDLTGEAFSATTLSSLVVDEVDVRSTALRGVIAATGGSVTDGHGSDLDKHTDFPSWLARRIQTELPSYRQKSVVNDGMGGTTAAKACSTYASGPSVEERVAYDSLRLPGLTHLIVYAGTNDIAGVCTADQIITAYRAIMRMAKAKHVKVLISTITPRVSYTPLQNAQRELVNAWVRKGGDCSGECWRSLDFDRVIRDPSNHNQIDPKLDSGDGMHPTGEGYRRIAASIPLSALS